MYDYLRANKDKLVFVCNELKDNKIVVYMDIDEAPNNGGTVCTVASMFERAEVAGCDAVILRSNNMERTMAICYSIS